MNAMEAYDPLNLQKQVSEMLTDDIITQYFKGRIRNFITYEGPDGK